MTEDYLIDESESEWLGSPTFTSEPPEFVAYKKIPRYNRDIIISEKIDGTNAVLHFSKDLVMTAGSRTRWIAPGKSTDNHGFASWAEEYYEDLKILGSGYHFGEWMGSGINRGYGLLKGEKRLYLFREPDNQPESVYTVPWLYKGPRDERAIQRSLDLLGSQGSYAVPGYMKPEGVVIFDTASRGLHKITLEHDEAPKGMVR